MTHEELIIWASGIFLTESLPTNYNIWTDDQFNEFIESHAWEPFENWDAADIYESIQSLAHDAEYNLIRKLIPLKASHGFQCHYEAYIESMLTGKYSHEDILKYAHIACHDQAWLMQALKS